MQYIPTLEETLILQHAAQTHSLWGAGTSLEERSRKLLERLSRVGPQAFTMSGFTNGKSELACSLKRYYFELSVGGKLAKCVGLGAIFTHPAFRKKGLAADLIQRTLLDSQANSGCQYALLFSDIGERYYEKFGFRAAPAWDWAAKIENLPTDPGLAARKATSKDIPALLELFNICTSASSTKCARSLSSWPFFRELARVGEDLILSREGRDIGLLSITPNTEKGHLWVEEWFAPASEELAVWATLRQIALAFGFQKAAGWGYPHYRRNEFFGRKPRDQAIPMVATLAGSEPDLKLAFFGSPDHF